MWPTLNGWLFQDAYGPMTVNLKCTAVCRTVVIQQAVVGGGLEVLCG